jgi:hypothetical protein
MLSTPCTIVAGVFTSAPTQPVIDDLNAVVLVDDLIAIDVDAAGTGAMGLGVVLKFGDGSGLAFTGDGGGVPPP